MDENLPIGLQEFSGDTDCGRFWQQMLPQQHGFSIDEPRSAPDWTQQCVLMQQSAVPLNEQV